MELGIAGIAAEASIQGWGEPLVWAAPCRPVIAGRKRIVPRLLDLKFGHDGPVRSSPASAGSRRSRHAPVTRGFRIGFLGYD